MKVKVITLTCMLAGMAVQAQDKLLQGQWEVKQVTVEKNTDGKIDTTVYNTVAEVKELMRFPQMLEVKDAKTILLHYPGVNQEVAAEYRLNGDKLRIDEGPLGYSYLVEIKDGNLILTNIDTYISKPFGGQMENITKKLTIVLQQKQTK